MPLLSGHHWNAVILVASASVALAADRLSAAPARAGAAGVSVDASGDVASFVTPLATASALPRFQLTIPVDPFDDRRRPSYQPAVASQAGTPTVPTVAAGSALTAILIADERRVAVIDDATVRVGDVLRDGARVAAIHPDRVWVVEKDGRWRTLTLTNRGQER